MIPDGVSILEPPQTDTGQWQAARAPLAVRSFGLTDRGKVRERNEDQFLIATLVKALQVEQTSLPLPKVQHSSDRSLSLRRGRRHGRSRRRRQGQRPCH
jgi:hypothetical protein